MAGYTSMTGQSVFTPDIKPTPVPTPMQSFGPSSVGGFSTMGGQSLLVTPTGQAVGSAMPPSSGGQVPGASTGGGGGGGGFDMGQYAGWGETEARADFAATGGPQAAMEQVPQEPQIDFDAEFQPAFDALDQLDQTLTAGLGTTMGEIETGATATKGALERQQLEAGELAGQQIGQQETMTGQAVTEQETKGKSAISEARASVSELMQGIQARFGGTTGTGKFASEILGRGALKTIGGIRQSVQTAVGNLRSGLQQTVAGINQQLTSIKREVSGRLADLERETSSQKQRARQELDELLAQVGVQRGELQIAKSNQRMQILENYRDRVAQVNARNAAFKQDLFRDAEARRMQLEDQARQVSQSASAKIKELGLSVSQITGAAGQAGLSITPEGLTGFLGEAARSPSGKVSAETLEGATGMFTPKGDSGGVGGSNLSQEEEDLLNQGLGSL